MPIQFDTGAFLGAAGEAARMNLAKSARTQNLAMAVGEQAGDAVGTIKKAHDDAAALDTVKGWIAKNGGDPGLAHDFESAKAEIMRLRAQSDDAAAGKAIKGAMAPTPGGAVDLEGLPPLPGDAGPTMALPPLPATRDQFVSRLPDQYVGKGLAAAEHLFGPAQAPADPSEVELRHAQAARAKREAERPIPWEPTTKEDALEMAGAQHPAREPKPLAARGSKETAFNTPLSQEDESSFQSWFAQAKQSGAIHPDDNGSDYDFRGAFKAGIKPAPNGHWPDTFKKPNHATFSRQSQYAVDAPEFAGDWDGETYVPPKGRQQGEPKGDDQTIPPALKAQLVKTHPDVDPTSFNTYREAKAAGVTENEFARLARALEAQQKQTAVAEHESPDLKRAYGELDKLLAAYRDDYGSEYASPTGAGPKALQADIATAQGKIDALKKKPAAGGPAAPAKDAAAEPTSDEMKLIEGSPMHKAWWDAHPEDRANILKEMRGNK